MPRFAPRAQFLAELRYAIESRSAYAAGKLGITEVAILRFLRERERISDATKRSALELATSYRALWTHGVFPADRAFIHEWANFYLRKLVALIRLACSAVSRSRPFSC